MRILPRLVEPLEHAVPQRTRSIASWTRSSARPSIRWPTATPPAAWTPPPPAAPRSPARRHRTGEGRRPRGRIGAGLDTFLLDLRYAWRGLRKRPASPPSSSSHSRSASAPTPRSSASSTRCCSSRCPIAMPTAWSSSGPTDRGRLSARAAVRSRAERPARRQPRRCAASAPSGRTGTSRSPATAIPNSSASASSRPTSSRCSAPKPRSDGRSGPRTARPRAARDSSGWDLFAAPLRRRSPRSSAAQIIVNDQPATVIGVMPRDFRLLLPPDSAVPDRLRRGSRSGTSSAARAASCSCA